MSLRWHRFPGRFSIILIALTALLLCLDLVNGRFWLNDFRVYYEAANALRHGEPLYGVAHGLSSGYFKYAPAMAMLYAPLSVLPYTIAAVIQYALIVCAFMGSITVADQLARTHVFGGAAGRYAPLFIALVVVVAHLHRELHLGNINVMLVWLLLLALDRLLSGRDGIAGLLIGLAILAKPHFAVLLPLLALRGHWSAVWKALLAVAFGLLIPMLFTGPSEWLVLHGEWLGEMAKHNASLIYTGGEAYNNVDTAYSFLHRAVLKHFIKMPHTTEAITVLALIAGVFGWLVLQNMRRERANGGSSCHVVVEYFLLMALVPSITVTDTNHFLFSMPLVLLIVHHILPPSVPKWMLIAALPALLLFGGNWADALGHLSDRMVHFGVLGIANLGLIAIGAGLLLRRSNLQAPPASS